MTAGHDRKKLDYFVFYPVFYRSRDPKPLGAINLIDVPKGNAKLNQ